jgi:phage tail tape-measure protein
MGSKKGLISGVASGAASGAAAGSSVGPWGTAIGGVVGGVVGGITGNAEDKDSELEQSKLEEEQRRKERETQASILLGLSNNQIARRSQNMNSLQFLASQRGSAEISARNRSVRDAILFGGTQ